MTEFELLVLSGNLLEKKLWKIEGQKSHLEKSKFLFYAARSRDIDLFLFILDCIDEYPSKEFLVTICESETLMAFAEVLKSHSFDIIYSVCLGHPNISFFDYLFNLNIFDGLKKEGKSIAVAMISEIEKDSETSEEDLFSCLQYLHKRGETWNLSNLRNIFKGKKENNLKWAIENATDFVPGKNSLGECKDFIDIYLFGRTVGNLEFIKFLFLNGSRINFKTFQEALWLVNNIEVLDVLFALSPEAIFENAPKKEIDILLGIVLKLTFDFGEINAIDDIYLYINKKDGIYFESIAEKKRPRPLKIIEGVKWFMKNGFLDFTENGYFIQELKANSSKNGIVQLAKALGIEATPPKNKKDKRKKQIKD